MSSSPDARAPAINRLLKMAVVGGAEAAVRLHIDRGDNLNSRDDRGLTPLMLAAARNKAEICRLLIDAGADLYALDPVGRDALAIAIAAGALGSASAVEAALARGIRHACQAAPSAHQDAAHDNGDERGKGSGSFNGTAPHGSEANPDKTNFAVDMSGDLSEEPKAQEHHIAQDTAPEHPVAQSPTVTKIAFTKVFEIHSVDDEDAVTIDPSGWEADESRPPPIDDASIATAQAFIQEVITRHAPIDDSVDCAHFEAFLPEHAEPLLRAQDAEAAAELKRLLYKRVVLEQKLKLE